jgi:hypothetical protein
MSAISRCYGASGGGKAPLALYDQPLRAQAGDKRGYRGGQRGIGVRAFPHASTDRVTN